MSGMCALSQPQPAAPAAAAAAAGLFRHRFSDAPSNQPICAPLKPHRPPTHQNKRNIGCFVLVMALGIARMQRRVLAGAVPLQALVPLTGIVIA